MRALLDFKFSVKFLPLLSAKASNPPGCAILDVFRNYSPMLIIVLNVS